MPKPLKYELDGAEMRHGDANGPNLAQISSIFVTKRPKMSLKFRFFSRIRKSMSLPKTAPKIVKIVINLCTL